MQVEKLIKRYEIFIGKDQFKLRDLVDLQYIHDIDYKEIPGIDTLTEEHLSIVKIFLVNFFNAWGLQVRASIEPIRVHSVLKRWWWIKHPEENISIWIKEEHIALDHTGKALFKMYERIESEYLHQLYQAKKEEQVYLRFEYLIHDRVDWVHIVDEGHGWY